MSYNIHTVKCILLQTTRFPNHAFVNILGKIVASNLLSCSSYFCDTPLFNMYNDDWNIPNVYRRDWVCRRNRRTWRTFHKLKRQAYTEWNGGELIYINTNCCVYKYKYFISKVCYDVKRISDEINTATSSTLPYWIVLK